MGSNGTGVAFFLRPVFLMARIFGHLGRIELARMEL